MKVEFSEPGIKIHRNGRDYFLFYMEFERKGVISYPNKVISAPDNARLTYSNGMTATVQAVDSRLVYKIENPGKADHFGQNLFLPKGTILGAQYQLDGGARGALPAVTGASKQIVLQKATAFLLHSTDGTEGMFRFMRDNQPITGGAELHTGWSAPTGPAIRYKFHAPLDSGTSEVTIQLEETQNGEGVAPVDQFGQPSTLDFPGKIKSEDELRADLAEDLIYYNNLTPPERSLSGGMIGGPKFKATGFFRLDKFKGRDLLVTPTGEPYFHLAVCGVGPCDDFTYIEGRRNLYAWLPPLEGEFGTAYLDKNPAHFSFYLANVIRKTGKPIDWNEWKGQQVPRLRKWGFTAAGAFAAPSESMRQQNFPYVTTLPVSSLPQLLPLIFDPFEPENKILLDQVFSTRLPARANDPLLVGYYISNEQRYTDICRQLPQFRSDKAAKRELAKFLKKRYPDVKEFNRKWKTKLNSLDEIADTPLLVQTEEALGDTQAFAAIFLDNYFQMIREAFLKYDKNHLLIGARFLPAMTRELEASVVACGKYVDVFSVNYYSADIDAAYLRHLHELSGRPLILSEWSFGSAEQGLTGGCVDVNSETERGESYRNYVEQAAALPYVVGHEWFAYLDQALTGRWFQKYNGESMNIGLLNVADRPFKEFLKHVMKTNYQIYDVVFGKVAPFRKVAAEENRRSPKRTMIPRALPGMAIDCQYTAWPGRPSTRVGAGDLSAGKKADDFSADFNFCWDETNLYFFAVIKEPTPGVNSYSGKELWKGDALEFFFGAEKVEQDGPLLFSDRQLLLGGTPELRTHFLHSPTQFPVQAMYQRHPDRKGWTMEGAIPWEAVGIRPESGMKFRFDFAIDDAESDRQRLRQFLWSGDDRNSQLRTGWGTAQLVD